MIGLEYKDSIQLVKPVIDEYGSEKIGEIETVPALFIQNTGWTHQSNQEAINANSIIYIDPSNDFVLENFNRLEEMLVIANPFSALDSDSWYKVIDVTVGQDKLLTNQIDNIRLELKKTVEIEYVI